MRFSALVIRLRALAADLPPQASATFVLRVLAVAAEFACLLVMARIFGANAYGSYALAMSVVAIAVVPALFGFDRLIIREVATASALADAHAVRDRVGHSARMTLVASGVIALIVACLALLSGLLPADLRFPMAAAAVLVPIIAFTRLQQAALQGLGHVPAGLMPESLVQPMALAIFALALAATEQLPRNVGAAIFLQVIAAGSALVVATVLLQRRLPVRPHAVQRPAGGRSNIGASATFMWLIGMSIALVNIDTLLTGLHLGPAPAGAYRVASQLAMFVGFPLAAVSIAVAPSISALHATGRKPDLRGLVHGAARVIVCASAVIAVAVLALGKPILAALGPGFEAGYPATVILTGAYLLHAAMATSTYLLFMTEHERLAAAIFTVGVGAQIAANLALVPVFGIVGTAIAMAAGLLIVSSGCALAAWRKLGIDATIFGVMRHRTAP